jgi:hypothetical protein
MEAFTITSFKYGVDTRKTELTSQPGTLLQCENGHISPGGTIQKRFAFVQLAVLSTIVDGNGDQGTFGIQETDSGPMVFGSAFPHGSSPTFSQPVLNAAMPVTTPQIVYQQLTHPEMVDMANGDQSGIVYDRTIHRMTSVVYSIAFQGKPFVAAKFADGRTYEYFNGTLVQSSRNGIVMPNETSLAAMGKDLARQINTLTGWGATKNGDTFTGAIGASTAAVAPSIGNGATITTNVTAGVVTSASVVTGGTGYAVGDLVFVQDPTGSGAIVKVATVNVSAILTVTVVYGGFGTFNGVDIITSPHLTLFTPNFPPNTSQQTLDTVAGLVGTEEIDQNDPGIAAVAASAGFIVGLPGGPTGSDTWTLQAPEQSTAQTPMATLANAVPWNTTATQTATDIVTAVNKNTIFTGYTASNVDNTGTATATVTVTAPTSFGKFTLLLEVTVTGHAQATPAGPFAAPFSIILTPPNLDVRARGTQTFQLISGSVVASTSGATGNPTFAWTVNSSSVPTVINPTGSTCTVQMYLNLGQIGHATIFCAATDTGGTGVTETKPFQVVMSYTPIPTKP